MGMVIPDWLRNFPLYLWVAIGTWIIFWAMYFSWLRDEKKLKSTNPRHESLTGRVDELLQECYSLRRENARLREALDERIKPAGERE